MYFGVEALKFFKIRRQFVEADTVHRREPQIARNDIMHLIELVLESFVVRQNFLARLVDAFALARQGKTLAAPLNQKRREPAFHRPNLLTDGRLRDFIQLRRLAEALRLHQIPKNPKRFNLHLSFYNK